jgi:hypothetical protein
MKSRHLIKKDIQNFFRFSVSCFILLYNFYEYYVKNTSIVDKIRDYPILITTFHFNFKNLIWPLKRPGV